MHFVSDRPAPIMVANWRAKIVRSFGFTDDPIEMPFSVAMIPLDSSRPTIT